MQPSDWPVVAAIYQQGIQTGHATFETQSPATWEEWVQSKIPSCCLVAREANMMLGWAALSAVSNRCVYDCRPGVADRKPIQVSISAWPVRRAEKGLAPRCSRR